MRGLTLTGNPWLDLLIAVAAGVTALGVLWRGLLRPGWRFMRSVSHAFDTTIPRLAEIAEAAPVILNIANELRNNGGSTIKDSIGRIEVTASATASSLEALSDYTHRATHKFNGDLMQLGGHVELLEVKVTDLTTTVAEQADLKSLLSRWVPSPPTTSPKENP